MKKQKLYYNTFKKYVDIYTESLIMQDIYPHEYFSDLINYIIKQLIHHPNEQICFKGEQILNYISLDWNGRRFFDKTKNLTILFSIEQLNLTEIQKNELQQHMKEDYGCFIFDLQNYSNKESFIILNTITPYKKLPDIIGHQLIHYFQWNTGRSKRMKTKEQNTYNDFIKIFHFDPNVFLSNNVEFSPYIYNFFSIFKNLNKITIKFYLDQIFDLFQNPNHLTLQEYKQKIQNIKNQDLKKLIKNNQEYFDIFKVCGFYCHSFNKLKNECYGYLNK